jgi:FkbM family methyltransferase
MKPSGTVGSVSAVGRLLLSSVLRAIGLYVPFEFGKRTLIRKFADHALDRTRVVRARRAGLEFELDLSEEIEQWIFVTGWWEKADLKRAASTLESGQTVFDVGANVGLFALHAARAVGPTGRVFVFEPNPEVRRRLTRNLQLNRMTNVAVQLVALGDRIGEAKLFLPGPGSSGGASLLEGWRDMVDATRPDVPAGEDDTTSVRLGTLDSFCEEHSIERIDSIKIDVEGLEPEVLEGGRRMLSSCRPKMLIEFNRPALSVAGWTAQAFLQLLGELGYEVFMLPRFGRSLRRVTASEDLPQDLCNLHCRARPNG